MRRRKPAPRTNLPPEQQLAALYDDLFHTATGAAVLEDLSKRFERRSSFVPGRDGRTEYNEGQRSVVLLIRSMMQSTTEQEDLRG